MIPPTDSTMMGGAGDVKPADADLQAILDPLKDAAQAKVTVKGGSQAARKWVAFIVLLWVTGARYWMEWRLYRVGRSLVQNAGDLHRVFPQLVTS